MARSRLDQNALRLITAIAGTRDARVSAMALDQHHVAAKQLLDAGFILRRGSTMAAVAEDDLDDALIRIVHHPIHERAGQLGNAAWQDEEDSAVRRLYAMDMLAVARRALSRIDCSLSSAPVPYLDGAVLDFGTARLPRRTARIGVWVARGLTSPRRFEALRDIAGRRPADGLRVVIALDPAARLRPSFLNGHEIVALEDVVDHEDGLAVHPETLAARLVIGRDDGAPLTMAADGASINVRGKTYGFRGSKQRAVIRELYAVWCAGQPECLTAEVLETAGFSPSVNTLAKAFSGRNDWRDFIQESGGRCGIIL